MKYLLLALLSTLLLNCTRNNPDDSLPYGRHQLDNDELSLIFSHNINGETHPCGCHQFPRGGLAQMAGLFHELGQRRPLFYVDTGDAFFPSSVIPSERSQSLGLTAMTIAKSLDQLGLKYFVPGDQDFALGLDFLREITENVSFHFLISNLRNPELIKHKEWAVLERGDRKVFLVGLVDPNVFIGSNANHFLPLEEGLKKTKEAMVEYGYNSENPNHQLIVLSHSGMPRDRELARAYPEINWIIGAHTSSYTQVPNREGETTLVQVLSRNHFAGEVRLTLPKNEGRFILHEVKDTLDQIIDPNPITKLIDEHLKRLTQMQEAEQRLRAQNEPPPEHPYTTAQSCLDCHAPQGAHWERTTHAAAYLTLIRAGQPFDLSCIQCHALGTDDPRGFKTAETMVKINPQWADASLQGKESQEIRDTYWSDFREAFKDVGRLKDKSGDEIQQIVHRMVEKERFHGVSHNFAHVQCLNCHDQHHDHPFHVNPDGPVPKEVRFASIKNRCLQCHDSDQSPNWYHTNEQGLPGELNNEVFQRYYKKIACPLQEDLDSLDELD